jgi:hypothetical protein
VLVPVVLVFGVAVVVVKVTTNGVRGEPLPEKVVVVMMVVPKAHSRRGDRGGRHGGRGGRDRRTARDQPGGHQTEQSHTAGGHARNCVTHNSPPKSTTRDRTGWDGSRTAPIGTMHSQHQYSADSTNANTRDLFANHVRGRSPNRA